MKPLDLPKATAFYLQSRRRLGFSLKSEGSMLEQFAKYAHQIDPKAPLTTERALHWVELAPPTCSPRRARRLEAVRHFAIFWAAFDPRTQIPPAGLYGPAYRRGSVHVYSRQEIAALMNAATQLPPPESLRPHTFGTLLGLLACTGLRISEALHLQRHDWDPLQAALTIRQSKFGQSRYVPLDPTAARALNTYCEVRRKAFPRSHSSALFLDECGHSLTYGQVNRTFGRMRDQLGWNQNPRPRLHDLRHDFAIGCLLRWYGQGQAELNTKILSLAVYLGHRNIRHTYWYLTAVPELLAMGTARWAKALANPKGAIYA